MKFLDEIGLAYFWEKIKASFVKTKGASEIEMDDDNEGLKVNNVSSSSTTLVPSGFISYNINSDEQSEMVAKLQFGDLLLKKIHIINGTSSQILIADGSTKTINAANGICGLDSNGNVPLRQLGNLDTTVAEVVTALPTTNIKKHIYLIKDASGVSQNQYEEYIYTGDTSATYDASKWEKLGDFRATVDLAGYAKKNEAMYSTSVSHNPSNISLEFDDINGESLAMFDLEQVSASSAGVMIPSDKKKLDGIAEGANNYSLPTASSTLKGGITLGYSQNGKNYPVVLDSTGKAYVNVPWIDTNTTYDLSPYAKKNEAVGSFEIIPTANDIQLVAKSISGSEVDWPTLDPATSTKAGIMKSTDKVKLDGIASGATADSAIPISVIDALN